MVIKPSRRYISARRGSYRRATTRGTRKMLRADARGDNISIIRGLVAAKASALSMPASIMTLRSNPTPRTVRAFKVRAQSGQGSRIAVDDHHLMTILHHEPAYLLAYPATTHLQ